MERCKGTRDLLPKDMARLRRVEDVFRRHCLGYGFQEVRTPTLEYLHFFTATGTLTPKMLGTVYSFLDWDGWSGERVVLRPDATIPIARLYKEHFQRQGLAKLFYVENTFRFTQNEDEARERWQCGAELLGSPLPEADVELIALAMDVLGELGFEDVSLELSHAGIVKGILGALGLDAEAQTTLFDRILNGGSAELETLDNERLRLLLQMRGATASFLKNLEVLLPPAPAELQSSFRHLQQVAELLTALGRSYQINPALARGFEYYTGTMFELFVAGQKVGGGGRWDNLVAAVGGNSMASSGFALYADEIMELLAQQSESGFPTPKILIRASGASGAELKACYQIAQTLRRAGYVAELDLGHTDTASFRWVLSIEAPGALFRVSDQATGQRRNASLENILVALEELK